MSSRVKVLSSNELNSMSTVALIGRRTKLLQCEESFKKSDRYGHEEEPCPEQCGYVEFKDQLLWQVAYKEVREILANREHLPTAAERKARRQEQSKKK